MARMSPVQARVLGHSPSTGMAIKAAMPGTIAIIAAVGEGPMERIAVVKNNTASTLGPRP